MKNRTLTALAALAAATAFTSCSQDSDNPKYAQKPPMFSDLSVEEYGTGSATIHVGQKAVATAVQKSTGRQLNKTTYSWTLSPNEETNTHRYTSQVIYDYENQNPVDTITFQKSGDYTLTFQATYNGSGNTTTWANQYGNEYSERLDDRGLTKATYTVRPNFGFTVTITTRVSVVD